MNNLEKLDETLLIIDDIRKEIRLLAEDRDFYKRILIQAMLTSGGVLKVENKYREEATNFKKSLEFGNEKVCVEYGKGPRYLKV